jgi:hypothetical protein
METSTLRVTLRFKVIAAVLIAMLVSLSFPTTAQETGDRLNFHKVDSSLSDYGYVSKNHLWLDHVVTVCWENPTPDNAAARILVEQSVEQSWQRYANLTFTGWTACALHGSGVHLFVTDEQPRSLIGRRLNGVSRGVRINLTFHNWQNAYCENHLSDCIRTVAIHEFGHVIGLIHESLRSDAPKWCRESAAVQHDDSDPGDGDERTPYDATSIMNYCNLIYGRQNALSENDKKVAELMYPFPGN